MTGSKAFLVDHHPEYSLPDFRQEECNLELVIEIQGKNKELLP